MDAALIAQLKKAIAAILDGEDKQAIQLIDSVIAQLDTGDNVTLLDT